MTVIGITGPSGAGKSTALGLLQEMGAYVIDCDAVYHALLETNGLMLEELNRRFPGVVRAGVLDRKALGAIVFHDSAALQDLSAITHGYVKLEVGRRLEIAAKEGRALAAVEAIALIESGVADLCTLVLGVIAPVDLRLQRLMEGEGLSLGYATARIQSQKPDSFFRKHCDYILENAAANPETFIEACTDLFRQIAV